MVYEKQKFNPAIDVQASEIEQLEENVACHTHRPDFDIDAIPIAQLGTGLGPFFIDTELATVGSWQVASGTLMASRGVHAKILMADVNNDGDPAQIVSLAWVTYGTSSVGPFSLSLLGGNLAIDLYLTAINESENQQMIHFMARGIGVGENLLQCVNWINSFGEDQAANLAFSIAVDGGDPETVRAFIYAEWI